MGKVFKVLVSFMIIGIAIVAMSGIVCASHYPFASSFQGKDNQLNEYWNIFGIDNDDYLDHGVKDIYGWRYSGNSNWEEWMSLKFAWTAHDGGRGPYREEEMGTTSGSIGSYSINGLDGVTGNQPNGYLWSWNGLETWPDNTSGSPHYGVGSYHFDQLAHYINGIYNLYMWTGDGAFISSMLPKAEYVMDNFLLNTMQGSSGVLICPGSANDGTSSSRPSTYMDQIKSGYKDAWINDSFYTALLNMADIEKAVGNTTKSNTYANLANQFPARFDTEFWDSLANRYIGWRDVNGVSHDYGFTYINLEALARGLGNTDKANRIFDWLDSPASPTVGGAYPNSTNSRQNVFGYRTNTENIPLSDWDTWSDASEGRYSYGTLVENGGSVLFEVYYDIMARLRYRNADDAYDHFDDMLNRVTSDSHKLTFNTSPTYNRWDTDFNEDVIEIGTNEPYPESGISAMAYFYGFMGVNANSNGLVITPNLPTVYAYAQTNDVNYRGTDMSIKVSRCDEIVEQNITITPVQLVTGGALEQTFTADSTFNEVGLMIGNNATSDSGFTLQIDKWESGAWQKKATKKFVNTRNNTWFYMAFGDQTSGTYRISIYDVQGSITWFKDPGSTYSGTAYENGNTITGDYTFRVVNSWQTLNLNQDTSDIADELNNSLAQTFDATAPFDRVSMRIRTYTTTNSGFRASLYQDVGERWQLMQQQVFANVLDNSDVTMNFASQPQGRYKLVIDQEVGSIAWWRNTNDVVAGDGVYALTDEAPVSGDRMFSVYQGKYRIEIPAMNVNTVIDAGDSYTVGNTIYQGNATRSSAAASSAISGWSADYAIDGNTSTTWSSNAHVSETSTESIYIDMGGNYLVNSVELFPRSDGSASACFPKDFKFQYSDDASNWIDVPGQSYTDYANPLFPRKQTFKFASSVNARYIRLYATKLTADQYSVYYLQLAEFNAKVTYRQAARGSVTSSSNLDGWPAGVTADNNNYTSWSSSVHQSEMSTEWIYVDLSVNSYVSRVRLFPRLSDGVSTCFPKDFKLQYSTDATNWTDIPGQSYTNYSTPSSSEQTFTFSSPVFARYIRLYATKLTKDIYDYYYCQIGEFNLDVLYPQAPRNSAVASSEISGWSASSLIDGGGTTCWSSNGHFSEAYTEWIYVDLGTTFAVNRARVYPRISGSSSVCFPKDFKFQYSTDAVNWYDVAGQSYTNYTAPGASEVAFTLSSPVNARYIRIYATKLRSDEYNIYYLQMAELNVDY